jgi:hypothetical protein
VHPEKCKNKPPSFIHRAPCTPAKKAQNFVPFSTLFWFQFANCNSPNVKSKQGRHTHLNKKRWCSYSADYSEIKCISLYVIRTNDVSC